MRRPIRLHERLNSLFGLKKSDGTRILILVPRNAIRYPLITVVEQMARLFKQLHTPIRERTAHARFHA
jgi:hypothetical protein